MSCLLEGLSREPTWRDCRPLPPPYFTAVGSREALAQHPAQHLVPSTPPHGRARRLRSQHGRQRSPQRERCRRIRLDAAALVRSDDHGRGENRASRERRVLGRALAEARHAAGLFFPPPAALGARFHLPAGPHCHLGGHAGPVAL
eukprot:scaffold24017_cov118-Isochrysis_galbana.AAC.3